MLLLLSHKPTTIHYVVLQLLLLGIATSVFYVGAEIVYEARPRGLGYYPVDMRALPWMAFLALIALCGYLYFWYASVHLLAQFTIKIGLAPAQAFDKDKAAAT